MLSVYIPIDPAQFAIGDELTSPQGWPAQVTGVMTETRRGGGAYWRYRLQLPSDRIFRDESQILDWKPWNGIDTQIEEKTRGTK
ncbi:MAG: hypothetical protein AAFY20_19010 [Cyanobacteria bacterium J06639_14]